MEAASTSKAEHLTPLMRLKKSDFFPKSWETLLNGVVAYVDVRTGSDNRSRAIEMEMERMGATVVQNFCKKVTHFVFKDGSKPIYDKAKNLGIPIVSYLWIEACKNKGEIVPTQDFPSINSQDYDSEFFKWKKVKSMQPKDLDEEMRLVEQRLARRRKKRGLIAECNKEELSLVYTPVVERKSAIDMLIESSPMVQERIHEALAAGKSYNDIFTLKEGDDDDFDNYLDTPLMIKFIAQNYYSPYDPPPQSIRRILSDVKRQSSTPAVGSSPKLRPCPQLDKEDQMNPSPLASPLHITNQTGKKRKRNKSVSAVTTSKKRKENVEDVGEKMPRRKLLFQNRIKHLGPEEPLVALTPDESPKTSKRNHPCFSQAGIDAQPSEMRLLRPPAASARVTRRSPRRESLADFRLSSPRKRAELRAKLNPTLVCTSLHSEAFPVVEQTVEALRGFKLQEIVEDSTTVVVCGDPRRTMNVMRAVVRGIKLVTYQWVLDSKRVGLWLDEDKYPVERFSSAAAQYRQGKKTPRLFKEYPSIYVSSKSLVPQRDIHDLIRCAGGQVATNSKYASLIIGQVKSHYSVPCINGTWILDCIEKGVCLPLTEYILKN